MWVTNLGLTTDPRFIGFETESNPPGTDTTRLQETLCPSGHEAPLVWYSNTEARLLVGIVDEKEVGHRP